MRPGPPILYVCQRYNGMDEYARAVLPLLHVSCYQANAVKLSGLRSFPLAAAKMLEVILSCSPVVNWKSHQDLSSSEGGSTASFISQFLR